MADRRAATALQDDSATKKAFAASAPQVSLPKDAVPLTKYPRKAACGPVSSAPLPAG